jgi:hypothetical protein
MEEGQASNQLMDFWLFSKITRTVITYQNQGFDVYLEQ